MDVREKLVELLDEAEEWADHKCDVLDCETCPSDKMKGNCVQQLMVDRLISHGVTVQEWISVKDRLPEDDLPKDSKVKRIKVQVAYRTNGNWIVRTQVRAKRYWYGEPDRWDWIKISDPITHWMPLPEPPKEVEDGN